METKKNLKLILWIVLAMFISSAFAQIPNGSFEEWEKNGAFEKPKYWQSNQSVEFERIHRDKDAVKGGFSIKLTADTHSAWNECWSKISTSFTLPGSIGEDNAIVFYYKSIPDTVWRNKKVFVAISVGGIKNEKYSFVEYWNTYERMDTFTKVKIPIPNLEVDSLEIRILGGANNDALDGCSFPSTTWIDGISFEKPLVCKPDFYPNPSPGYINIQPLTVKTERYYVYNLDGRLLEEGILNADHLEFQNHLHGLYLLRFGCENGLESEVRKIAIFK